MAQGVIFGDYFLLGRLNRGGMAEVYLAKSMRQGEGDRLLAFKRTLPELSNDADFVTMFRDEASIARSLSHPNICRIYDQGEIERQLYIVMEFIHGKDLKVVQLRARELNEQLPLRYVVFTVCRIAHALDFAHKKTNERGEPEGIVHRDVSPHNILISYDGVPKLIDFGIAKAKTRIAKTQVGVLKGKFAYMSPEQALGRPVDHRTDVFALGAVLYELITGRHAFKGNSDFSTLQHVGQADFTPPERLNPEVPERLAAIVARALARLPEDRYQSAADMAYDLERFLDLEGKGVNEASLATFMRKHFREDYTREAGRIKQYIAAPAPAAATRKAGERREQVELDATGVAPSFIKPGQDSHEPESSGHHTTRNDKLPEMTLEVAPLAGLEINTAEVLKPEAYDAPRATDRWGEPPNTAPELEEPLFSSPPVSVLEDDSPQTAAPLSAKSAGKVERPLEQEESTSETDFGAFDAPKTTVMEPISFEHASATGAVPLDFSEPLAPHTSSVQVDLRSLEPATGPVPLDFGTASNVVEIEDVRPATSAPAAARPNPEVQPSPTSAKTIALPPEELLPSVRQASAKDGWAEDSGPAPLTDDVDWERDERGGAPPKPRSSLDKKVADSGKAPARGPTRPAGRGPASLPDMSPLITRGEWTILAVVALLGVGVVAGAYWFTVNQPVSVTALLGR